MDRSYLRIASRSTSGQTAHRQRKREPLNDHHRSEGRGHHRCLTGIGAALVTAYRKHGCAVVASSRSITASDDPGLLAVAGDIADRVIEHAMAEFGRVDTLINNAGIFIAKPFADYTEHDYAALIGVNLTGFFTISRLAITQMLTQGGGHVVNVTTSLVDHANSNVRSVLASLTKGGLQSATKSLAIEYPARSLMTFCTCRTRRRHRRNPPHRRRPERGALTSPTARRGHDAGPSGPRRSRASDAPRPVRSLRCVRQSLAEAHCPAATATSTNRRISDG
jgi:NAD(P)-dependent dehydrogenase (short-subunit alcohol dehydrogenase family)